MSSATASANFQPPPDHGVTNFCAYLDGFVSLGVGENHLDLNNGTFYISSDYKTPSVTVGGAVSGVIERDGYEIWPEVAFTYGHTEIGDVDFTGRAYGLVDDTLVLNADSVRVTNFSLRPEFRVPLDDLSVVNTLSLLTFAPQFLCERVEATGTQSSCGAGAEVGVARRSNDSLSQIDARVMIEQVGDTTRSGFQLKIEHRF
ncbi:hypothetical protein [Tranquillimonas alkanivorans]|uniref:Autotransporter domain-containing protein n=1 Tax=Tranquillimonas alkanivorans TaxID=441119 RepID=A0A1I5UP36_9RHOB|nr:hypothetical protein [Tranquillimonas alkanivorans]SFP96958.1 hypothetical protein SAMN04488047_12236 [Tranquillimonas alkanivorans]